MRSIWEETYRQDGNKSSRIRIGVVLNKAARADTSGHYLVAIKVTQGNDKRYFINVDNLRMSEEDFSALCRELENTRGRLKRYRDVGERIKNVFDCVCSMVESMVYDCCFAMDDFKERWKKRSYSHIDKLTPYILWQQVAESKSAGTEMSYLDALKRFTADMGTNVAFHDFSKPTIIRWRDKMLSSGLSKTTANIHLRSLRVVLNNAVRLGLLTSTQQLFDGLAIGGRNSYNDRKEHYLTVAKWCELWHFYETSGDGNGLYQSWRKDYQTDRMEALGMMLFMYLANGMNLRDALCLRYDDYYFQHDRKQLHFQRQKVANRSGLKVIFPVLPQMRTILERIGEKEERNGLVFGYLKNKVHLPPRNKDEEKEIRRLTALYNSTIGDRMKSISKAVGLEVSPTPTWCRHSFASNLIQAGVPKEYISASMAHSEGGTTDNYIDRYSYEQMYNYNSRLLSDSRKRDREFLKELLAGMNKEEILSLLDD